MVLQPLRNTRLAVIALVPMLLAACVTGPMESEQEARPSLAPRPPLTKDGGWILRLPQESKVAYHGVVSFDHAGAGQQSMLYPAPNAVGFIAAVVTHGIINESVKTKQKNKLREQADKVLQPYRPVLDNYWHQELMQRGLEKMPFGRGKKPAAFSEKPDADWTIESIPVYFLTQDQSAIILDNAITIYATGNRDAPVYQRSVRVVSQPRSLEDPTSHWTAELGKNLKEQSATLFAESVEIALLDATNKSAANNNPHRTYRYLEGNIERMERGQLISAHCDRIVIRTLRDEPMSIPVQRNAMTPAGSGPCTQATN